MKNLGRFFYLHGRALYYALAVIVGLACGLLRAHDVLSIGGMILTVILTVCLPFFAINLIAIHFYSKPLVEALDIERDPYPLLEESEYLLAKLKKGLPYLTNIINYSAGLVETGQFEKALAVLQAIDFSKAPKRPPQTMFIYYNNLCAACNEIGYKDQASVYYSKALSSYAMIKSEAVKKQLKNSITFNTVEEHLRNEEYPAADKVLSSFMPNPGKQTVDAEMLRAKVHIGLGEPEKAKEHLTFVIENGNKLNVVNQAKEILASL
jgi:tetratricopeptide (TPR) repeat protein